MSLLLRLLSHKHPRFFLHRGLTIASCPNTMPRPCISSPMGEWLSLLPSTFLMSLVVDRFTRFRYKGSALSQGPTTFLRASNKTFPPPSNAKSASLRFPAPATFVSGFLKVSPRPITVGDSTAEKTQLGHLGKRGQAAQKMNQSSGFYSLHGAAGWAEAPTASSGGFTDGNPWAVWNSHHDEVDAYDEIFASTTNLMEQMDLNSRGPEAPMTSQPLESASMRSQPQQDWPVTTQRGRPGWVTDRKGVRHQRRQQQRPAAAAQRHGVRKSPSQSQRTSYGHSQLGLYLGRIEQWLDPVRGLAGNIPASGGCGLQVATCWEAGSITNMKQGAVVAAGDDLMAWEEVQEEHMDDSDAAAAAAMLCSNNTVPPFGSEPPAKKARTWTELAWAPLKDGTLAWQDPWAWFFDELDPTSRGNLTEPPLEWLPMHDGSHAWQDPLQWRRELFPESIPAQYDDDDDKFY